jgi:hypothetical protein
VSRHPSAYLFTVEPKKIDRRGCPPGQGTRQAAPLPNAPDAPRGLIGNPPHIPTPELRDRVQTYAKVMSQKMIAASFDPPISEDTLQRHYRAELDAGKREAVAAVGGRLLAKAMAGNLTAMIFYLRTQGGWAAKHEFSGPGGQPLRVDLTAFLADKDEDDCRAIEQVLAALAAAGGVDVAGLLSVGNSASQGQEAEPRA